MNRRIWTEDVKRATAADVASGRKSRKAVKEELGISDGLLSSWIRLFSPGKGKRQEETSYGVVALKRTGARVWPREVREKICADINAGRKTRAQLVREIGVTHGTLSKWLRGRTKEGRETEKKKKGKRAVPKYSLEFKLAAVDRYKKEGHGARIAAELGISDVSLYYWAKAEKEGRLRPDSAQLPATLPSAQSAPVTVFPQHARNGKATLSVADGSIAVRDATVFLRKGKSELFDGIRRGKIHDLDNVHLMLLLAHNSLHGK